MTEYRSGKLAVLWTASDADSDIRHAGVIRRELEGNYRIECHERRGSAEKTPELCLEILRSYGDNPSQIVICSIAGRRDALSGFLSANGTYPVIACPPSPDPLYASSYLTSSLDVASKSSPLVIKDPKNAARAVASILALTDPELRGYLEEEIRATGRKLREADRHALEGDRTRVA